MISYLDCIKFLTTIAYHMTGDQLSDNMIIDKRCVCKSRNVYHTATHSDICYEGYLNPNKTFFDADMFTRRRDALAMAKHPSL